MTRADQVAAFVAATRARFGGIDILFSNAGNFGTVAPIADYPEEVFDAVYAVHVTRRLPRLQISPCRP